MSTPNTSRTDQANEPVIHTSWERRDDADIQARLEAIPAVTISGFNIIPGLAFRTHDHNTYEVWVATTKVNRDLGNEVIHVIARALDPEQRPKSFTFDFCDDVSLVGASIHPNDSDDTDIGTGEVHYYDRFVPVAEKTTVADIEALLEPVGERDPSRLVGIDRSNWDPARFISEIRSAVLSDDIVTAKELVHESTERFGIETMRMF